MGIRKPASWMVRADDRILEWLESNVAGGPKSISDDPEIDYNREHIARRLRILNKGGLLERPQRGTYTLSDRGAQYLAGVEDLRDEPEP